MHVLPVRALLVGTEQGATLENTMRTLPIGKIFEENVDVSNGPYKRDYLSVLQSMTTFKPEYIKLRMDVAVKSIIALREVSFFKKMGGSATVS